MKLFLKNFLLSSFLLLIAGCGSGNGPGATALNMYKEVCAKNDFSEMLKFVAPESAPLMQLGINMMKDDGEPKDQEMCKQEIKLISEKITGDTAIVNISLQDKPMDWKKVEGKWKLYLKK
ncbi:hypothetical protein [Hydrogenophaga sp.]|uniref:hypothetical protein n=1 Tax=Hydrogenophaga sp. TaxID=1904254 RepID=UPI0027335200|nr:hypothetical protein [Hydrogenophaga sp.]MDP1959963.1 hypothetical protein [Methylotenera sp.]MDP3887928.1 hypothetical protein [Hydrogenophaga sp.]